MTTPTMLREKSRTPWGPAQTVRAIAPGIVEVSTAGHGGIKLDPAHNRQVHEAWRERGGWYEEDCCWAIVVVTFPERFTAEHRAYAERTAKEYYPDGYHAATGIVVQLSESRELRYRAQARAAIGRLVVRSAWIDDEVPFGFVRVAANVVTEGDASADDAERNRSYNAPRRIFTVPSAEYDKRGTYEMGFVFDEGQYPEFHETASAAE